MSVSIDITRCGRLDAFAVWFDLQLYDDVTITTSPQRCWQPGCGIGSASCWEQAIYPVIHAQRGTVDQWHYGVM